MEVQIQAFFTQGRRQKLFNVLVSPADMQDCRAIVLFIPALWDEMNHSRHLVTAQARLLAAEGIATLILDPEGTGDSYGDYASADWEIWLEDYVDALEHWSAHYKLPVILWGMRAGALLAGELLNRCGSNETPLLLWNPVFDGESALREMIRVKLAGQMMGNNQSMNMKTIRESLKNGDTVTMAGYSICGDFAGKLTARKLVDILPARTTVIWVDVLRNCLAKESPAKIKLKKQLEDMDSTIRYSKVEGPSFWQSVELEFVPDLLSTTKSELLQVL